MLELGLDALAAYRLTRLATADVITRPARARVIRWSYLRAPGWMADPRQMTELDWDELPEDDDNAPKVAAFVKCRWCAGMWISLGVVVARRYAPRAWDPLARALAISAAAALLARLEDE